VKVFRRLNRSLAMDEVIQFIIQHGYSSVFASVLADQIGVPVPASPILLAGAAIAAKRSPPSAPSRGRVQGVESEGLSGNYRKGHRAKIKPFQVSGFKFREAS